MRGIRVVVPIWLVLVLVALAPPAYAGGPTSVVLSGTRSGQAARIGIDQTRYAELESLLGDVTTGASDPPAPTRVDGPTVQAIWLIHDIQPWRTDTITRGPDGRLRVCTTSDLGVPDGATPPACRTREVRQPERLIALLADLGLWSADATTATASGSGATSPSTTPAPATTVGAESVATSVPGIPLAGSLGLLLGVAGALLVLRLRRRSGAAPDGVSTQVPESGRRPSGSSPHSSGS